MAFFLDLLEAPHVDPKEFQELFDKYLAYLESVRTRIGRGLEAYPAGFQRLGSSRF